MPDGDKRNKYGSLLLTILCSLYIGLLIQQSFFPHYSLNKLTGLYEKNNTSECKYNCTGHNAGYNWAFKNEITEEFKCSDAMSESFKAGCLDFASTHRPNDSGY